MPNPFKVIREELPKFLDEPQAEGFKGVLSALIPQDLSELGLAVATGPVGKAARLGGLALASGSYAPEAEASGLGKLLKYVQQFGKAQPVRQAAEELGAQYLTKAPGPAKAGRVFTNADLNALRDELAFYAKPRVLSPERNQALMSLLKQAEEPGVKTHVLYTGEDFSEPASAFQLMSEHALPDIGYYMPNLVALLGGKGTGTQAIQEARRAGPYGLVSTPTSRAFYEKISDGRLQGFGPHADPELRGIAYQYKKDGGLVEADDDFAYPGMF